MRTRPILLAALTIAALGSCARVVPPPRPEAPSRPIPRPAPRPMPTPSLGPDWRDWPASAGTWRYARSGDSSTATFGTPGAPQFVVACGSDRRVRLTRVTSGAGAMTVRTTSTSRVLATDPNGVAVLAASDPLLDAIGYSRGRFMVEMAVQPALVLPAWAEVLRVVEDCRD